MLLIAVVRTLFLTLLPLQITAYLNIRQSSTAPKAKQKMVPTEQAASLKHTWKQNSYQLLENTSKSAAVVVVGFIGAEKDPEVAG